jgi:hypothetical protein
MRVSATEVDRHVPVAVTRHRDRGRRLRHEPAEVLIAGRLLAIRIARPLRFRPSDVDAFIDANTVTDPDL